MINQIYKQSIKPLTDVIQLTLTLKMTTAQVVETSVIINNNVNSPIQHYVHPDDQAQPTLLFNDSWAQTFHSENEFNMKARLKVETKYIPRNALHEKTSMLVYLLRLLQHTFNRLAPQF